MCVCLYVCIGQYSTEKQNLEAADTNIEKKIYCEELAHVIMEADKSQDL